MISCVNLLVSSQLITTVIVLVCVLKDLHLAFESGVKVVLDVIVCASRQLLCDL